MGHATFRTDADHFRSSPISRRFMSRPACLKTGPPLIFVPTCRVLLTLARREALFQRGTQMPKDNAFYMEEYKSLRQEIATKLKERLEFSRWGLIGLAALYSYIFSNPGKPILFWVPFFLSLAMLAHLNEEHRMVHKAGAYIKEQFEPWAEGGEKTPMGWQTYLKRNENPSWLVPWKRFPPEIWDWSPVPLWVALLVLTFVIASGVSAGWWPSLIAPPAKS
jgi:hypothetical protein